MSAASAAQPCRARWAKRRLRMSERACRIRHRAVSRRACGLRRRPFGGWVDALSVFGPVLSYLGLASLVVFWEGRDTIPLRLP